MHHARSIAALACAVALAAPAAASAASVQQFHNPTGNVGCRFYPNARTVVCADFSTGTVASIDPRDPAESDVSTHLKRDYGLVKGNGSALPYGQKWQSGIGVRCTAIAGAGVRCRSAKSGHGFTIGHDLLQRF